MRSIKESEKLPIKIKDSLEKGKIIDSRQRTNNNKNNLYSLINLFFFNPIYLS